MKRLFFNLLIIILLPAVCWPACSYDERKSIIDLGFLWVYSESRNDANAFVLTIYFEKDMNHVKAVMYDPNSGKNIKLIGDIDNIGHIRLHNTYKSGVEIILEGKYLESDPSGRYDSNLNCEVIAGTYYISGIKHDFILGSDFGYRGSIDNRYSRIGADNDDIVEQEVKRFIDGVKKRDKKVVAKCMNYPVRIGTEHGDKYINNEEEFISKYDYIFKTQFSKAILKARPYHLHVTKYDEALLGTGLVTFIKNGKVSVILNWDR